MSCMARLVDRRERRAIISRYPTLPWDPKVLERDCFICQPAAFMRASSYRRCPLDPDINRSFDYDSGFAWRSWDTDSTRSRSIWPTRACIPGRRPFTSARPSSRRQWICCKRHYGYVPFPWVFGYARWRRDGRDQFFEPLRPTLRNYLTSLPLGLRLNSSRRFRFFAEWLTAPIRKLLRKAG